MFVVYKRVTSVSATVHTSSPDLDTIQTQTDFLEATYWSKRNKLPINFDKTTYMLLGARKRIHDTYQLALSVDDITIKQVSKQKLFGIVFDDHLSWTPQVDHLCSILSTKISLLKKLSSYVPEDIQKCSIKLIFCLCWTMVAIYGATRPVQTLNDSLNKLQKRTARVILQANYMTPSSYMFEQLDWLSIPKRLMIIKLYYIIKS